MTQKIWTAAELEAMEPADVDKLFESSVVRDVADAPPEARALVRRSRERIERDIAEAESSQQQR